MWKNPLLVCSMMALAALLFVLASANCTAPVSPPPSTGDLYFACNFPYPLSLLFGPGLQRYQFNLYFCLGVPAAIILFLYLQAVIKRRDE